MHMAPASGFHPHTPPRPRPRSAAGGTGEHRGAPTGPLSAAASEGRGRPVASRPQALAALSDGGRCPAARAHEQGQPAHSTGCRAASCLPNIRPLARAPSRLHTIPYRRKRSTAQRRTATSQRVLTIFSFRPDRCGELVKKVSSHNAFMRLVHGGEEARQFQRLNAELTHVQTDMQTRMQLQVRHPQPAAVPPETGRHGAEGAGVAKASPPDGPRPIAWTPVPRADDQCHGRHGARHASRRVDGASSGAGSTARCVLLARGREVDALPRAREPRAGGGSPPRRCAP